MKILRKNDHFFFHFFSGGSFEGGPTWKFILHWKVMLPLGNSHFYVLEKLSGLVPPLGTLTWYFFNISYWSAKKLCCYRENRLLRGKYFLLFFLFFCAAGTNIFISRPVGSHKFGGADTGSAPRSVQPNQRAGIWHCPEMAKIRRGLDPPLRPPQILPQLWNLKRA